MYNTFFQLIRVALSVEDSLSHSPSPEEWQELYALAKKQSLVGICFAGVQRLPEDCRPPEDLYYKWMGITAKIQHRNDVMDVHTHKVLEYFREKGYPCQVLKGQGIAQLYKDPLKSPLKGEDLIDLSKFRQSGDIDVWLNIKRKELYKLSLDTFGKIEGLTYHHIHYPMYEGVEVEAHVLPSVLSSPLRFYRFKKFCKEHIPVDASTDNPTLAFNRVFILQHCYSHFCGHGVGLRQLMDYYFVLLASQREETGNWKEESLRWIKKLGMEKFARATMWLLHHYLGLDNSSLLCEPNEEYGKALLEEVLQTGNMGHGDERVAPGQFKTPLKRYLYNLKRDISLFKICPHEALWDPIWGLYQFTFCKVMRLRWK